MANFVWWYLKVGAEDATDEQACATYRVYRAVHKSNCRGASPPLLNHDLHAIDATPARWRSGVGLASLDSVIKVHPTH